MLPNEKSLAPSLVGDDTSPVDNTGSSAAAPARLWSIDALRGLCAGIVFLSHWHLWSDFAPRGPVELLVRRMGDAAHDVFALLTWPTGGHHPAVLGFFVLSGFCIHYPFERRKLTGDPRLSWAVYFRRRFCRIMPVYWAACVIGLVFVGAEMFLPSGSPLLALHATASAMDVAVRGVALTGVYPREVLAGNYTLTTVTVEIFMYAVYPLIHPYAMAGRWRALGLVFLAVHLLAVLLLRFFTPYWVFNSIFMLGIFWYAGALAAHLYLKGRAHVSGRLLLLVWAVFLVLKALPPFHGLNLLKQAAWGLVCMLGIIWCLRWESARPRLVASPAISALRHLADVSYTLYATHTPAIMLASWTLLYFGVRSYPLQLLATLAASVATTLLVYRCVERVFYRPLVDTANPAAVYVRRSESLVT